MKNIKNVFKEIEQEFYGDHTFVQTSPCGRGEHRIDGLVGKLWRITDPKTVRIGDCFLEGRLKKGDLFLCIKHSGDCFQNYMYIKEYMNAYEPYKQWTFGSYGIGDSTTVEITKEQLALLKIGEIVYKTVGFE